ncbi:MAG: hypothetical protein HYZ25_09725 [Chloroflexi bacterium]|nr:hypothetical protein [Chloroflexota bacterium]
MVEVLQSIPYYIKPAFTIIGLNFLLVVYGIFQVYKYLTEKNKQSLIHSLIALGSPIIFSLCVLLLRGFFNDAIKSIYGSHITPDTYPYDVLIIPGICTAFSLAVLAFGKPDQTICLTKLSNLIYKAKIGILGGLSVFSIMLIVATIIFVKAALFFGTIYTNIGWEFFYYPTLSPASLQIKLWAYGFFMLFTRFFYVGFLTPFLWAINGAAWTNGKKSFALLLTIHLGMFYIELPLLLALIRVDP